MASRLQVDHASLVDNDVARQLEFLGEFDGDECEFAVRYGLLKELSGDEPENDAIEMFERFSEEIVDACIDAAARRPTAGVIVVDEQDLE